MYINIKVDDKDVVKVVCDNNTQASGLIELAKSALDKWFALKSASDAKGECHV